MFGYTEVIKQVERLDNFFFRLLFQMICFSQFERGDVTDTNYEYVLCAPDVYADILHLRKKISKEKFPNPQYGLLNLFS